MRKNLAITVVIAVTLFASSAFASWAGGTGTGSCEYEDITFYPFQTWGPPSFQSGTISGSWSDNAGNNGGFLGTRDSVVFTGLVRKSYYHGTVTVVIPDSTSAGLGFGTFSMVATDSGDAVNYAGVWQDNNGDDCDCTGGTISGREDRD